MRLPEKAPKTRELMKDAAPMVEMAGKVQGVNFRGRYVHWDKLKHLSLPEGMTIETLWAGLKLNRHVQRKNVPLSDTDGEPFAFCIPDQAQEMLLFIDQNASGRIEMPDQITNPQTKDRYVVNSLIEEAVRSSQLEGAATTRRATKEMIRTGRSPANVHERMVLNNFNTMQHIVSIQDSELTPDIVLDIHRRVTEDTLKEKDAAGRFRKPEEAVQVYSAEGEALHVPPAARELPGRMQHMCDFANGRTPEGFLHPVLRSVILHFWLAYDHPFVDGNGRAARALFYWSMLRQGYWLCEFISISQILRNAPAKYARSFLYTETDENDLTYFILYNLEVIKRAIGELYRYVGAKVEEIRDLERRSRKMLDLNARQKALISHALRHPDAAYTFKSHCRSHGVVRQTARNDLLDLAGKGYLRMAKVGRARHFFPVDNLAQLLSS